MKHLKTAALILIVISLIGGFVWFFTQRESKGITERPAEEFSSSGTTEETVNPNPVPPPQEKPDLELGRESYLRLLTFAMVQTWLEKDFYSTKGPGVARSQGTEDFKVWFDNNQNSFKTQSENVIEYAELDEASFTYKILSAGTALVEMKAFVIQENVMGEVARKEVLVKIQFTPVRQDWLVESIEVIEV